MYNCIGNTLYKLYLNFTWFSMVAMNGDEGDKRFKQYYKKNSQN